MRFVSIDRPFEVSIRETRRPVPGKGEALLRMLYGGICGSDLGAYRGSFAYVSYPRVPGHEISACIEEIGENDAGLKPGMNVTVNPYFNCGVCYSCRRGFVNACMSNKTMGVQREGAFAEYFTAPIGRIHDGRGIPARTLALVEPFCIAWHGVRRAQPQKDERVLIVGSGTIGLLAAVAARSSGAEVWVSDVAPEKLASAREFGAAGVIVNRSPEELAREVDKATGGEGFDVTIEAVGLASTFQNCIDSAAYCGRVVLIGVSKQHLDFDFTILQKKELAVFGSRNARNEDFEEIIDLVASGKTRIEALVTDVHPFEKAAEAFADLHAHGLNKRKVLLEF